MSIVDRSGPGIRKRGIILAISFMAIASFVLAPATLGKNGNNGTVKIHEGADESSPVTANDPHVCTFHLHFMFGDDDQTGGWWIESWPPTGDRTVVMSGSYDASGDGEDRYPETGATGLADGHYKLYWQGDDGKSPKHKVFWVECGGEGGGGGGGGGEG